MYHTTTTTVAPARRAASERAAQAPVPPADATPAPAEAKETPWAPTPAAKDVRAYEHDRHRVKKAAELVKLRARKEQARAFKEQGWSARLFREARRELGSPAEKEKLRVDDFDLLESITEGRQRGQAGGERRKTEALPEVRLADLVVPQKARKSKRADGDFEVVPHVRSVIVLDDFNTQDVELDEPWEHVYGEEDDGGTKYPSYARILSNGR